MTPLPPPQPVVIIHENRGGIVATFSARIATYARRHTRVIVNGECDSSCTMVLGLKGMCATASASFGFHQAYYPNPADIYDTTRRSEAGTRELQAHYPPLVMAWIEHKGGLGPDLMMLEGAELARVVPLCGAAPK